MQHKDLARSLAQVRAGQDSAAKLPNAAAFNQQRMTAYQPVASSVQQPICIIAHTHSKWLPPHLWEVLLVCLGWLVLAMFQQHWWSCNGAVRLLAGPNAATSALPDCPGLPGVAIVTIAAGNGCLLLFLFLQTSPAALRVVLVLWVSV